MNANQIKQSLHVAALALVVLETLEDLPEGMPSGHAYIGLSANGLRLDSYQALINGLVNVKAITLKDHYIERGEDFKPVMESYKSLLETAKRKGFI